MVFIKALGEELTDVEMYPIDSPNVPIGGLVVVLDTVYTLFDKSDILINKIEKLPVLRDVDVDFHPDATCIDVMIAAGGEAFTCEVYIFNADSSADPDDMIFTKSFLLHNGATGSAIYVSPNTPKKCAILLGDKFTIEVVQSMDDIVAGAAFGPGTIEIRVNLNIDWVPVTPNELKEYALEQLYINM